MPAVYYLYPAVCLYPGAAVIIRIGNLSKGAVYIQRGDKGGIGLQPLYAAEKRIPKLCKQPVFQGDTVFLGAQYGVFKLF